MKIGIKCDDDTFFLPASFENTRICGSCISDLADVNRVNAGLAQQRRT